MLFPRRLKIQGFRGFRDQVEFCFDRHATMLFGENRSGKSSTLNAIEWCLFGDACVGKQTGIRERIGWVIHNRHLPLPEVCVELELANNTGCYTVERRLHKGGKKSMLVELQLILPDGECLTGEAAQQRLTKVVGAEFRDFMTTVYQHQESIRAVLTQEPRERNNAIDRLLGLAVYRNLLDGMVKVKAAERRRTMRAKFEAFETGVQTALSTRKRDLDELRQEASRAGVPWNQQQENKALGRAAAAKQSLDEFARDAGLAPPALVLPQAWTELPAFEAAARQVASRLRSEMPGVKEQQALFRRQKGLLNLKVELENIRANRDAIGRSARQLDAEYGGQQALSTQVAEVQRALGEERERFRQAYGKAALIGEAIAYLEQAGADESRDTCPLCSNTAPELLVSLRRQWQEKLQARLVTIDARIPKLSDRARELEAGAERYQSLDEQLLRVMQTLSHCHEDIGDHLGKTLCDEDDPLALLVTELEANEQRGHKLEELVETKQKRLAEVEHELHKVRLIHGVLHSEGKKKVLEQIQESSAFRGLETVRDEVADWVSDLEAIQVAVATVAHEEADAKLQTAERTIDTYFRSLTRNPAVQNIQLRLEEAPSQRNCYEISDQNGNDLTPILSQGDLNALALAIFLGLAACGDSSALGFVMLDDPSQSLGSGHKKQLVEVLNDVARQKRLLVATMDHELRALVNENLTKAKVEYAFGQWTPEMGPSVTRG